MSDSDKAVYSAEKSADFTFSRRSKTAQTAINIRPNFPLESARQDFLIAL